MSVYRTIGPLVNLLFDMTHCLYYRSRAAMKMANMDAVLDFMFTSPRHSDGV